MRPPYLQRPFPPDRDAPAAAGLGLAPHRDPLGGSHHPILAALGAEGPGSSRCPAAAMSAPSASF
jgi:hypothetical protein